MVGNVSWGSVTVCGRCGTCGRLQRVGKVTLRKCFLFILSVLAHRLSRCDGWGYFIKLTGANAQLRDWGKVYKLQCRHIVIVD